ncbi:MAG TPA: glycosyltransferase [Bacteroidetes bacterium]|nr:glycosyltransferase [Bacteroidota bacterium]
MNILLATYNFYPYHWGGSEVYVFGLAKYLQNKGHHVTILAAMPEKGFSGCPVVYEDNNIKIGQYEHEGLTVLGAHLPVTTAEVYSRYNPAWEASWLQFFEQYTEGGNNFDLLHLHAFTPLIGSALVDALKKTSPGIKTLMSYHVVENCPKGNMSYFGKTICNIKPDTHTCAACMLQERTGASETISKIIENLLPAINMGNLPSLFQLKYLAKISIEGMAAFFGHIDRWIFFSEQTQWAVLNFAVAENKTKVIRHGVSDHFFNIDRPAINKDGKQVFVYVGRFKKLKGFHVLLKAWLAMEEKEGRKLLLIGGSDNLESEIKNLLEKINKRNDVEVVGRVAAAEVVQYLKNADCIIIPSINLETGPLVFHEAIAAGVNVIASNVGGCKELADIYKNGCTTFEPGNARSLSEKINKFNFQKTTSQPMGQKAHYDLVLNEINDLVHRSKQINTDSLIC